MKILGAQADADLASKTIRCTSATRIVIVVDGIYRIDGFDCMANNVLVEKKSIEIIQPLS